MTNRKANIPNKANEINLVICEPVKNNPSISLDKSAVYKKQIIKKLLIASE